MRDRLLGWRLESEPFHARCSLFHARTNSKEMIVQEQRGRGSGERRRHGSVDQMFEEMLASWLVTKQNLVARNKIC